MPHTNTAAGQACPTTSAWLIRTDLGDQPRVLVHLHKRYRMWLQPGGHVERDENAWQAILREVREEVGYDVAALAVLQPFRMPPATSRRNILTPTPLLQNCHEVDAATPTYHWDSVFAFVVTGEPTLPRAAGESDTLAWMTADELRDACAGTSDAAELAPLALAVLGEWEAIPASEFPTHPAVGA